MSRKPSFSVRWLTAFVVGLSLILPLGAPVGAASSARSDLLQPGIVIVPPGDPIEIATVMLWAWDATQDHLDAVQMAMDDYGSIQGWSVQRNDYDGGCDETSGENAANDAVANAQNVGVIGATCSSSSRGAAPVLEGADVVMISHSSTGPDLHVYGPTIFNRMVVSDPKFEGWDMLASDLASVQAWEAEFQSIYGHAPDLFAKYAYDATTLLLTRIDEVSSVGGGGNLIIPRLAVVNTVRMTTDLAGVTGNIALDENTGDRIDELTGAGTRYAAVSGDDQGNNCTDPAAPCASVQQAVTLANEGESVLVAQGTYTENVTIPRAITVEGGYEASSWTRDLTAYETILDGSGSQTVPGSWDGLGVRHPMVLVADGTYKMWYAGVDMYGTRRIGYATSSDGLNWTRPVADPVLDVGAEGEWDSLSLEFPVVVAEGPDSYKMWYAGEGPDGWRIGHATSENGIDWTKHPGNPVVDVGEEDWNNRAVSGPSILYEGGVYKMWLNAVGEADAGWTPYIAYATSADGVDWAWDAGNPLFSRDPGHPWESGWVWRPSVLHESSDYEMWYSAFGEGQGRTGYATSPDEVTWTKYNGGLEPVLSGTEGEWDEGRAFNAFAIYASSTYTMWYDNDFAIGVVTSTNGISWTKSISNPVFSPGTPVEWGQPVVTVEGSPVVLDGLTLTGGDAERAGGVDAGGADVTLLNCTIRDNVAYGDPNVWASGGVLGGNPLTILNSKIVDNQVGGGASGVRVSWDLTMVNSLVAGNQGDAAIHGNDAITLINVTMANNTGDIIFNPEMAATLALTNSIVYSHENDALVGSCDGRTCYVNYSDVEGGWPDGTGNIDANPHFVDAANGDYHLQMGSPCIDAGTPDGAPATDLEGTPRDAMPDMGAYERIFYRVYLPVVLKDVAP
jgi:predicted GH43/DUF377 family glycosyl hydrolase